MTRDIMTRCAARADRIGPLAIRLLALLSSGEASSAECRQIQAELVLLMDEQEADFRLLDQAEGTTP
jgi:hypothetical protein